MREIAKTCCLEEAEGAKLVRVGVVAASLGECHRPKVEFDRASEPRTEPVVDQDLQEASGRAGFRGL